MADEKTPPEKRDLVANLQALRRRRRIAEAARRADRSLQPKGRQALLREIQKLDATVNDPATREGLSAEQHARLEAVLAALHKHMAEIEAADEARVSKAISWLSAKWKDTECPYCSASDWQVGTPLEISLGPDESMSPAFPVMCGNCGHTSLINAVLAGLVDPPTEAE